MWAFAITWHPSYVVNFTFKSSPLKPLNQIKPNLAGMVPGWVPFQIVSHSPALHSRWLLLLKIEISLVNFCLYYKIKMKSNFNCSYMAISSLTYIMGFCVRFFSASLFHLGILWEKKITSKSVGQKFELKWSFGGPLSKLCITPPFSINFRCQIENQVSDYRLLGVSSLVSIGIHHPMNKTL